MNRNNLPLELVDPLSYGYLDTAQKQIIFDRWFRSRSHGKCE